LIQGILYAALDQISQAIAQHWGVEIPPNL